MTEGQVAWVGAMQHVMHPRGAVSSTQPGRWRRLQAYKVVTSLWFEWLMYAVVLANAAAMAVDRWQMEADYPQAFAAYQQLTFIFAYIYYCEAVLKIFALGGEYLTSRWCLFELVLVCCALLDQFASQLLVTVMPVPSSLLCFFRILRVLRILRLLRASRGLRDLVVTVLLAGPALINIMSTTSIVLFSYAALGVQLFTFVLHGEDFLNDDRNFDTFGNACLILFQCLAGGSWSAVMDDCMVTPERGCAPEEGNCGTPLAVPYFISFQVIGTYVFLNKLVAVVLEHFSERAHQLPELAGYRILATSAEDREWRPLGQAPRETASRLSQLSPCSPSASTFTPCACGGRSAGQPQAGRTASSQYSPVAMSPDAPLGTNSTGGASSTGWGDDRLPMSCRRASKEQMQGIQRDLSEFLQGRR